MEECEDSKVRKDLYKFKKRQAGGAWLNELSEKYYAKKWRQWEASWPCKDHMEADQQFRKFLEFPPDTGDEMVVQTKDAIGIDLEGHWPKNMWKFPSKNSVDDNGNPMDDAEFGFAKPPETESPAVKAARVEAVFAQGGHSLVGIDAIGAPAISHDFGGRIERWDDPLDLRQRRVERARNVTRSVFICGADIEHGHRTLGDPGCEAFPADWFGGTLTA